MPPILIRIGNGLIVKWKGCYPDDISDSIALLALQGPKAQSILALLTDLNLNELKSFRFIEGQVEGVDCVISRTGYTGEDGFEIYLPPTEVTKIWETLLEKGKPFGLAPIGLGARDTLRLEAKLPYMAMN